MNPRFILGAAAAVAAVLAVPSFASAATTCSYDTIKRQVDIQLANPTFGGQTAILRVSGGYIKVADNNELPPLLLYPGLQRPQPRRHRGRHEQDPCHRVAELRARARQRARRLVRPRVAH